MVELARSHTTVSVERATLRLAGIAGADPDGIPWVNRLVDAVVADVGLGHGVAVPVFDALTREGSTISRCWRRRPPPGPVRSAYRRSRRTALGGRRGGRWPRA